MTPKRPGRTSTLPSPPSSRGPAPKKKRFEPGKPLDLSKAICYDSDESSEGDLFDDLEVLGEEG